MGKREHCPNHISVTFRCSLPPSTETMLNLTKKIMKKWKKKKQSKEHGNHIRLLKFASFLPILGSPVWKFSLNFFSHYFVLFFFANNATIQINYLAILEWARMKRWKIWCQRLNTSKNVINSMQLKSKFCEFKKGSMNEQILFATLSAKRSGSRSRYIVGKERLILTFPVKH